MNDIQLFAFESDFVSTLRCVPMAVRFKLDRCGIKLSLRQWSRFTHHDRQALLLRPCCDSREVKAYRAALTALVALRTGEVARPLAEAPCGQWDDGAQVAPVVVHYALGLGVRPPNLAQWAALSTLQRFVLIKLTRANHDNVNFVPALREFGLAARQPAECLM
ncbi:MAG: nitrate reductase associated protein [Phenylobacterium sp.]